MEELSWNLLTNFGPYLSNLSLYLHLYTHWIHTLLCNTSVNLQWNKHAKFCKFKTCEGTWFPDLSIKSWSQKWLIFYGFIIFRSQQSWSTTVWKSLLLLQLAWLRSRVAERTLELVQCQELLQEEMHGLSVDWDTSRVGLGQGFHWW